MLADCPFKQILLQPFMLGQLSTAGPTLPQQYEPYTPAYNPSECSYDVMIIVASRMCYDRLS